MTEMNQIIVDGSARGTGVYEPYKALWHLQEIGVLDELESYSSSAWDQAQACNKQNGAETRVALIDTSVAAHHPNLEHSIDQDLAIDFFSNRLGTLVASKCERLREFLGADQQKLPEHLPSGAKDLWDALIKHLKNTLSSSPVDTGFASKVQHATRPSFSAHGTAMAGLIGARPLNASDSKIAQRIPRNGEKPDLGFAYAGVDPFCKIVPISTNFDPEPEQLILTILYSVLIGADLIVLARDFPTPKSLVLDGEDATQEELSNALGVGLTDEEMQGWALLEDLLLVVSDRIPIVCAAGNGGDDNVLYPASLAAANNGILSVGARTALRRPASYTPVSDSITIYAPSGDGERLDQGMRRVDTVSVNYRPEDHSSLYRKDLQTHLRLPGKDAPLAPVSAFSPLDLISTDVPGRAGYNSSPFSQVFGEGEEVLDYRSCFCRFSGTSGAVAVVAGFLSLAISAGKATVGEPGDGKKLKAALTNSQQSNYEKAAPALAWSTFSAKP